MEQTFHYHAPMDCQPTPLHARPDRTCPHRIPRWHQSALGAALALAVLACGSDAHANGDRLPPTKQAAAPVANSGLDAGLFYQLLIGELQLTQGEPGAGFSLMLDAARKTKRPELFRRAIEIALQARSGESALQAARAWTEAQPRALDPQRYVLQILLALNRPAELTAPLRAFLRLTPAAQRNDLIQALPPMLARLSDKTATLKAASPVLLDAGRNPAHAAAAWTTLGRLQLAAGQKAEALESALRAHAQDSKSPLPAWLALALTEQQQAGAEALLLRLLDRMEPVAQRPLRFELARLLMDQRRYGDAQLQLQTLTRQSPGQAEPWLLQGLLLLQINRLDEATASIEKYLALPPTEAEMGARGHTQAYLLLSQIAERRGQLPAARDWLDRIEGGDALEVVQVRRAMLLAREGRLDEARALLRGLPESSPADTRRKLLTEAQLLRDLGRYAEALQVYENAAQRFPDDVDLAYERAMTAEKAGRFDEMERLLRELIARAPDYAHAYNALGYALADRKQDLAQARKLILRAIELSPEDPFIQDSLGWVEYRLGNLAEARRVLQAAYAKRPDAEIAAHLGEVLWASDQHDAALRIWRAGLNLQSDNETLQRTLDRFQARP